MRKPAKESAMGRTAIDPPAPIDYLSILDENGNLDTEREPDIASEVHLKMFRAMLLGRRFDEKMLDLQLYFHQKYLVRFEKQMNCK